MQYVDLTFPTPDDNLACDESLLDLCESGYPHEILRFWEPADYFVVLGHSTRIDEEVNLRFCRSHGIPVLRRRSGGGAVLQGPGCLSYSLVLRIRERGPLRNISETNGFILECHRQVLGRLVGHEVGVQGFSDLTIGRLKFSGNAQYRRRRFLLFHGTFLLQLDMDLMEKALLLPTRQPPYRQNRSHKDFLTNLRVPSALLRDALRSFWKAKDDVKEIPFEKIQALSRQRYSRDEWHFKF